MAMQAPHTFIWVRIGDAADCQAFESPKEAGDYLKEHGVGRVAYWRGGGVETVNCRDYVYIVLYRGDANAKLVSNLLPDERVVVEDGLQGSCDMNQRQIGERQEVQLDRKCVSSEGRLLGTVDNSPRFVYRKCG
jgi:hypothetical protein